MSHPRGERTCCACRTRLPAHHLVRIASRAAGEPTLPRVWPEPDRERAQGRGAYLCPRLECLEKARSRRSLERALRLKTPFGDAFWTRARAAWMRWSGATTEAGA